MKVEAIFDKPYQERPHPVGSGVQRRYRFSNGYGASVVRTDFSYGGDQGLWELAVIDMDDQIVYTTPITNAVVGWLTEAQVEAHLHAIADLEGPDT